MNNKTNEVSTIYMIKLGSKVIYVGSTSRPVEDRWTEHRKSLEKGKHSNKSLQKAYNDNSNFTYEVVAQIPTDNTLIKFFAECLVNSIYCPSTCKCIVAQGRMRIILKRCNKDLAQKLLDCILEYYTNK